jgi:hypothetical protein
VDYSAPAGSNEGIILSRKPQPASPILNIVTVFTPFTWAAFLATFLVALVVTLAMDWAQAGMDDRVKRPEFSYIALQLYADLLGETKELPTKKMPRSKVVFLFTFSLFGMFVIGFFMKNMMFAVMVAATYEKPIDTAATLLERGVSAWLPFPPRPPDPHLQGRIL